VSCRGRHWSVINFALNKVRNLTAKGAAVIALPPEPVNFLSLPALTWSSCELCLLERTAEFGTGKNYFGLHEEQVADCCADGNERSDSVKSEEFPD